MLKMEDLAILKSPEWCGLKCHRYPLIQYQVRVVLIPKSCSKLNNIRLSGLQPIIKSQKTGPSQDFQSAINKEQEQMEHIQYVHSNNLIIDCTELQKDVTMKVNNVTLHFPDS